MDSTAQPAALLAFTADVSGLAATSGLPFPPPLLAPLRLTCPVLSCPMPLPPCPAPPHPPLPPHPRRRHVQHHPRRAAGGLRPAQAAEHALHGRPGWVGGWVGGWVQQSVASAFQPAALCNCGVRLLALPACRQATTQAPSLATYPSCPAFLPSCLPAGQLGAEGFIMGSLYTTVGLSAAALVLVAPRIKDPSTQRVASYGILLVAFMAYRCVGGQAGGWVVGWAGELASSAAAVLSCTACTVGGGAAAQALNGAPFRLAAPAGWSPPTMCGRPA